MDHAVHPQVAKETVQFVRFPRVADHQTSTRFEHAIDFPQPLCFVLEISEGKQTEDHVKGVVGQRDVFGDGLDVFSGTLASSRTGRIDARLGRGEHFRRGVEAGQFHPDQILSKRARAASHFKHLHARLGMVSDVSPPPLVLAEGHPGVDAIVVGDGGFKLPLKHFPSIGIDTRRVVATGRCSLPHGGWRASDRFGHVVWPTAPVRRYVPRFPA